MSGCILVPLIIFAALASLLPEFSWMRKDVYLKDRNLTISVEHRSEGTFRMRVWNDEGTTMIEDGEGFAPRRVNLYASPSGNIITDSYESGTNVIVSKDGQRPYSIINHIFLEGNVPSEAAKLSFKKEMKLAQRWRYLGVVRRGYAGSYLVFTQEPECVERLSEAVREHKRLVLECSNPAVNDAQVRYYRDRLPE